MADELAIQPQIIEPKKKDNSLAYGATGAVAGGVGGWAVNRYLLNGAKNLSDLAADASSKDKVELSSKYADIESATLDDLIAKAKAVKEAEAKLAEASKAGLPENAREVTEYNDAKKAFDEAYQKAYDREIAKRTPSGKGTVKSPEFAKITIDPNVGEYEIPAGASDDVIKAKNENLKEALKKKGVRGDGKKSSSIAQQFRDDFKELMEARQEVETQLTGIRNNRNISVAAYDTELVKLVNATPRTTILENLTDAEFNELLTKTDPVTGRTIFGKDRLGKLAKRIAESEVQPLNTAMTSFEESVLKELGAVEGKAPSGSGYKTFTVERIAANGEHYDVTFHMKNGEFESAIKKYNKNLDKLRKERAGKIVHGFRKRVLAAKENREYADKIVNSIKGSFSKDQIRILESEGLITRNAAGRINGFNEATVASWADDQFASTFRTGTDAEKKIANAKNELRKLYKRQMRNIDRSLTSAYAGVPSFTSYDTQVAEAFAKNERLTKINQKFAEKYKGVVEGGNPLIEHTAAVSTEVSADAKKAAEGIAESETKGLKEKMEAKEKALNEAKASKGTVDEAAKKAAQEGLDKAKSDYTKIVNDATAKYGKGKWKIAAPVIGALALGAAGWFAGHSDEA